MSVPTSTIRYPHALQAVPEPLGLFFRPGWQDHNVLSQVLSEGSTSVTGIVFDPCFESDQEELRQAVQERQLWSVLDTKLMELASVGGHYGRKRDLPWAAQTPDAPSTFTPRRIEEVTTKIAERALLRGYSAIYAPTHFLERGAQDPWIQLDHELVLRLRSKLDEFGLRDVSIFHVLSTKMEYFRQESQRSEFIARVADLPVASIWLRISPFGSDSGRVNLTGYIDACRHLHSTDLPIIAEKTGVVGLALLGLGAVSGVESGVTMGEKFNARTLLKPPAKPKPGAGPPPRVYLRDLGMYVTKKLAREFFGVKGMAQFSCRDNSCCRGISDMLGANRRRHFVHARIGEVSQLSEVPFSVRSARYMNQILVPATNNIVRAQNFKGLTPAIAKKLETERKKLDGWRITISNPKVLDAVSVAAPVTRRILAAASPNVATSR